MTMFPKQGRAAKVLELVRVKRDADHFISRTNAALSAMPPERRERFDSASRCRVVASAELLRLAAEAGGTVEVDGLEVHVTHDGLGTAIVDPTGERWPGPVSHDFTDHIAAVRSNAATGAAAYRARVAQGQLR
jgi:hypothetical protein